MGSKRRGRRSSNGRCANGACGPSSSIPPRSWARATTIRRRRTTSSIKGYAAGPRSARSQEGWPSSTSGTSRPSSSGRRGPGPRRRELSRRRGQPTLSRRRPPDRGGLRPQGLPFAVPAPLLKAAGALFERVAGITGRRPLLTAAYGKLSGWTAYYDNAKSRREFGHSYIDPDRTIADGCATSATPFVPEGTRSSQTRIPGLDQEYEVFAFGRALREAKTRSLPDQRTRTGRTMCEACFPDR